MALTKKHLGKSSVEYAVVEGSRRVALAGAKATGLTNQHATIEISIKIKRKQPLPPLDGRPSATISREELGETYGASQSDIQTVTDVFTPLGLKVVNSSVATRTVRLSGTVAAMESAFGVKLYNYTHPDGSYRGRVGSIHVPGEVKDIIVGVFGLDNRRVARRKRQIAALDGPPHGQTSSSWYVPAELAQHYNFPKGLGTGQAIGILEFGGGYFPSDLQQFCKMANTAVPNIKPISTDGTSTSAKDGAEGEVMLDIEVVAGVCPQATIIVYFAQWTEQGWITALDAAVHDSQNDPCVISASWGSPEDTDIWTPQAMTQINETLQEAALVGVTVCIAAGDDGSSDADLDGAAHADFPSASPYVLAIGGTTIPQRGGTGPDIVWFEGDGLRNDNGGSTGGGVSAVFPRPSWQSNIDIASVNPGAIVGRIIPDLSANADWVASPYLLVVDGAAQANGGTSAATPLVAALIALINSKRPPTQRVGYLTPLLYQPAATGATTIGSISCTDVVSGDNAIAAAGGYSAGPGYDAASGWGTPNGMALMNAVPGNGGGASMAGGSGGITQAQRKPKRPKQ